MILTKLLFSSKVRFICIVEQKAVFFNDSIVVFESENFEQAFKEVIKISKSKEKTYKNNDNIEVMWKLKEILTLDIINNGEKVNLGNKINFEVYNENIDINSTLFEYKCEPEKSDPAQTI